MNALVATFDGWELAREADRRFWRIALAVGLPFLILAILIPFLELSGLTAGGGDTMEERYVSLIPEAEPAEQVEEPAPAPEDTKEEPKEEPKPVEKPKEIVPDKPVTPEPSEAELKQQARQVAQKSGVMAFADQLAALRDQSLEGMNTARPISSDMIAAKSGTGAAGGSTASQSIAQAASASSSGIGEASSGAPRRTQSGAGLGQRRTTVVESPVGFGEDKTKPGQGGDKLIAGRTLEEIQLTFDRNKGAFYAIFTRAMRDNPNIGAGKIVVSITIQPDGSVSNCTLVSSSFGDPELEQKVISRVLLLNFGPKAVPVFTYPNYPINFLPS